MNDFAQIDPSGVTSRLRSLFDPGDPASLRLYAVLDGNAAGRILTDDADRPSWAIVQEAGFGAIYLGGAIDAPLLARIVGDLRAAGDVLIGLWPTDDRLKLLPPRPEYDGWTLDFGGRPLGHGLDQYLGRLPDGCVLRRVDAELFGRCPDSGLHVVIFGSVKKALQQGLGLCLMRGDEILCEAFAGPAANGVIELGVTTLDGHRRRGYATITCAHLIQQCEQMGYQTYWNCAKQNLASAALARKLGYRTEKQYRLLAWFKSAR